MYDIDNQKWWSEVHNDRNNENGNKLRTYRQYKYVLSCSSYVKNVKTVFLEEQLSNFRSGSLKLAIETGRYAKPKIPLENRLCIFCDSSHIETETHFLLHCDFYTDIRRALFSKANQVCGYFNNMNDTERMIFLMNDTHIINHVAKSLHTMFSRRKSHLSNL